MPILVPHAVIRPTSPMISFGPSFPNFHIDWEAGTEMEWRAGDVSAFTLPESENLFTFNCATTSGAIVATGRQFGPVAGDAPHPEGQISSAISDLRAVVGAIRDARLLPLAADLDDLLTRAVQSQGPPANIGEWARRLAADIGDLTD